MSEGQLMYSIDCTAMVLDHFYTEHVFSETDDDLELEFNQLANRNRSKNTNPFRVAI